MLKAKRKIDDIGRVATRKSLRSPKKTLKASRFDRERLENAWDSGDDVIEVEPAASPHTSDESHMRKRYPNDDNSNSDSNIKQHETRSAHT